ncbi:MAG: outer membrane protein assembly factor BamA [Geminicoccaceae bacterium]|nr:outer membrane protein assembly factor BamA [Geminicoccaceae bacterium]
MRRALLPFALLAFQPLVVAPALAQEAQGTTVRDVVVEGNQRIETPTIESYLTLGRGDAFDPNRIDASLKNLYATGLFDDVRIGREGDRLVVRVVENPIINRIAFEGNLRLDDAQLGDEVQLRPRVVYTRARVQSAVSRILELYRRNGRYAAKVEPKIIRLDQNRVDLVFEIEEGPLTKVAGISFIGNKAFSDGKLRGVVQTTEEAWYRFLSSTDTYDPDRLAFDQELLRRFYLERGYAEFAVVSAIAELTPDGRAFFITFTVDEGPQYRVGKVDVQSSLPDLSSSDLTGLVTTKSGTVYDATQVEETVGAINDRVGELGYAFAQIRPVPTLNREARTIDLVYQIDQGQRVYVERIEINGNVRTLDEVVRREFRLSEGDPYNVTLLRRSEQRIRNLGYFDQVNVTTRRGSAPDRVVIDVAVTERSTGELSFGAGYSTSDGILGDIRLTERNLLGRGQTVVANFTNSSRRKNLEFSFTEPYFLGYEFAAGFDVFRNQTDYQSQSSFDETSLGATVRGTYPLTERLSHSLRYTLRQDEISSVDPDASVFIQDEEGTRITSLVGQTLSYDQRDQRFLPSEGYIVRLDQDLAGIGGDNRFLKSELRGDVYFPLFSDVVLNLGAGGGYVFGYAGEDVRLANRFFIGGQSLRGFEAAGIGPRDKVTGDALGGNVYYTGTAELRFPLGLPEELQIFGRTFLDAGSLFDVDLSGPTLSDDSGLRVGAGIGLSWLSPLGPLSIDYGKALVKSDRDATETFRISFGARF